MGAAKLPVINCNSECASPRVSDNHNSAVSVTGGAAAFRSCAVRYLIASLGDTGRAQRTRTLTRRPRHCSTGILDQTSRLSASAPLSCRR